MITRQDKRSYDALREIKIAYEGLARADGSARFSYGHTASLASVSGPIEVRLAAEQASQATFEVITRPLSNIPGTDSKGLASTIRSALLPCLILNQHPRTLIQVVTQALVPTRTQWKDPLIASMINACSLALLNSGSIPLRGVVCAVAIGHMPGAGHVVDPSEDECMSLDAGGCFAFLFAEGIGCHVECVWTSWRSKFGRFNEDDFVLARSLAKSAVQNVYAAFKSSVSSLDTTAPFELASSAPAEKYGEFQEGNPEDQMEIW